MSTKTKLNFLAFLAIIGAAMVSGHPARANTDATGLDGASPGERSAITAICGSVRGANPHQMCVSNQIVSILRLGRKPDLSVASPSQRAAIEAACTIHDVPGERFKCERAQLTSAGLKVRDEPGAGRLQIDQDQEPPSSTTEIDAEQSPRPQADIGRGASPMMSMRLAKAPVPTAEVSSDLEKLRSDRPAMPSAATGVQLSPTALFEKIAPSIYLVRATSAARENGEVVEAQGSAVAISDKVLLTNCHVVLGRPMIRLSQDEQSGSAKLIYADKAGDRCFLQAEGLPLNPVKGVRPFRDLHVGEAVYSVGSPLGLERTFGQGMVSGLRKFDRVRMVQNSAPIWKGSSGGGLFDAEGNLVGITTAVTDGIPSLAFSIAAEDFWL